MESISKQHNSRCVIGGQGVNSAHFSFLMVDKKRKYVILMLGTDKEV